MSAILFGSISTLVDTSELQRRSFNEAFAAHDLNWNWSREDYRAMLGSNGGADRISEYASDTGTEVDAAAVHATKSEIFQRLIGESDVKTRPGVADTIDSAKANGMKVGFVTTTSRENIDALLAALSPELTADSFDVIVDASSVDAGKPDPASYEFALKSLGENASDSVAIEDNAGGVQAAVAAGITCVAFPNENTAGTEFGSATDTVDALDPESVRALISA
ncbi:MULTISPECIES: HAD-IA family hydrolase [unclassified Rhodococcus (in: high G+C Gram-positive bacteria)]|uniref:HAD-IA family hydrolase n=1 Tax=unclassified Rhodococcus (in: high G+C Gram-positive bacteria) TaxID=192944 RepID=UPI0007BBC3D8|nr:MULTISPECIES: HAD-IA family hydrolase [unclassified Rhodococcus (in: high G+C Gram-positive bacteria)]KZE98188.1 haloacid dehalogenase [Rhodococcus sp. EPR-147]KZF05123.1 haloacid dehalogenase [Rhodococcus sp. EPR-279]OZE38331.1 haloacid dehalogenase [Rhodococcus sp. 05-2254-4]OZE47206.1 haloacid dehalogenase [Rhodococcus sp. 05-2254-3]OZE54802.1 haloacid dehalogenase [Rhodococcus sp. 05-2254-2]